MSIQLDPFGSASGMERNSLVADPHSHDDDGNSAFVSSRSRLINDDEEDVGLSFRESKETYRENKDTARDHHAPVEHYDSDTTLPKLPFHNNDTTTKPKNRRRKWMSYLGALLALCCAFFWLGRQSSTSSTPSPLSKSSSSLATLGGAKSGPRSTFSFTNGTVYTQPTDIKHIGIVFYGRRQFADILDCYLRRNLKINGGMLDEIHFLMHTDKQGDLNWLKRLVRDEHMEDVYILKEEDTSSADWNRWHTYNDLYKNYLSDPNVIYIKFDDDLIFVDDNAVPELIRVTLEHPEAYSVVSNNYNNKWNHWQFHRAGVTWPYLPETKSAATSKWSQDSWRPSELPRYSGVVPEPTMNFTEDYPPPSDGHRWLPLEPSAHSMMRTPYGPFLPSPGNHNATTRVGWAVAAQGHYSFLENLERGLLDKYDFGNSYDRTWTLWYTRWNINLLAIRGSHVLKKPFWDGTYSELHRGDEYLMTVVIPRDLEMPNIVATAAYASHYSFKNDRAELLQTDILDRYRSYANEMVCGARNQKRPRPDTLRPHHLPPDHKTTPADTRPDDGTEADVGDGPQDVFNPENEDDIAPA